MRSIYLVRWLFFVFIFSLAGHGVFSQDTLPPAGAPLPAVADTSVAKPADSLKPAAPLSDTSIARVPRADSSAAAPPEDTLPPPPPPPVELVFVKYKTFQNPDSVFFNVLKVINNTGEAIYGTVNFLLPEGWKLLMPLSSRPRVGPHKTSYIPFRLTIPRRAKGGVGYIITAQFNYDEHKKAAGTCFVSVPKISNWKLNVPKKIFYFLGDEDFEKFNISISNRGNGNENLKLEFKVGENLDMFGTKDGILINTVNISPYTDTVLTFSVKRRYSDSYTREGEKTFDWKSNSILVNASSMEKTEGSTVWFKTPPSIYRHSRKYPSPLNMRMSVKNLLSNVTPSIDLGVYGSILFCKQKSITYNFFNPFILMRSKENIGEYSNRLWRGTRMYVTLANPKWKLMLGDRFEGLEFGAGGRGASIEYRLNNSNTLKGGVTWGITNRQRGASLLHELSVPGLPLSAINYGIGYGDDLSNKIRWYLFRLQTGVSFLKVHTLSGAVGVSSRQHYYNNQTFVLPDGTFKITDDPGKSFTGFYYSLSYSSTIKKLSINANSSLISSYFANAFTRKLVLATSLNYIISRKMSLDFSANRNEINPKRYYMGSFIPTGQSFTENYRFELYTRLTTKIGLSGGPEVAHVKYYFYNPQTGLYSPFESLSEKLHARMQCRIDKDRSISPFASLGLTKVLTAGGTVTGNNYTGLKKPYFNFSTGFTYRQKHAWLTARYNYGPYSAFNQTEYYYGGVFRRTIQLMPYFEVNIIRNVMKFLSYNSLIYEVVPSGNISRVNIGGRLEWYLKNDWLLFTNANLYVYSMYSRKGENVSIRSISGDVGFRKRFNIQQPCMKYYDLKIICFKDINANRVKDENEPGIDNISITVFRNTDSVDAGNREKINVELVTDHFGEVKCIHIPSGIYTIDITPLRNLNELYNINGNKQRVVLDRDEMVHYVPFVISYKVTGQVEVIRDAFSSDGFLSVENIRVTAKDSAGFTYSTLTDRGGNYNLFVPKVGRYKVTVTNPFGENFILDQEEFLVDFNGFKEFEVNFKFFEKKRPVNINGGTGHVTGSIIDGRDVLSAEEQPSAGTAPVATTIPPLNLTAGTTQPAATTGTAQPAAATGAVQPPATTGATQPPVTNAAGTTGTEVPVTTAGTTASTESPKTPPAEPPPVVEDKIPSKAVKEAPAIKWEETQYYITLGSFSNKSNAQKFYDHLATKDNAMIIVDKKGLYKVIYSYRNMDETLQGLEKQKSVFPAAWISKRMAP